MSKPRAPGPARTAASATQQEHERKYDLAPNQTKGIPKLQESPLFSLVGGTGLEPVALAL